MSPDFGDRATARRCQETRRSKADWRLRVGDYRILYEIADSIRVVRVYRVRHRRDVYE
ncbi:type II toxin-antitoxin system RelE/ParE family toxin [Luteolibacter sp. Populi]|uniref:type II toxin-antitoxin system RelE family toxin n=1 Tax=Luteolibacter sp. Populi TaxID=3230487 RepID=UPI003464EDF3